MSELARRFAEMPADVPDARLPGGVIPNPVKQDVLLELCRAFHGYLMKYLVMIRRGHVPTWGAHINKDTKNFIRYFLPKGESLTRASASKAVRHMHLAFKGKATAEIYDILMEQLLRAIQKYDPAYTDKVRLVAEDINAVFKERGQFTVAQLNNHLEFDCNRSVRMFGRRGFLQAVFGAGKERRIAGWKRTATWLPPQSFFEIRYGPGR
jgi:hypothetical protein